MSSTADLTFRPLLGDPRFLAEILGRPGVLQTGHFRLLSGLHAEHFLAFSHVAQDREAVRQLAAELAAVCGPWAATCVLAPLSAGVALGGELARELGIPLQLTTLDEGGRPNGVLSDASLQAHRVLLVNDVVTTGDGLAALKAVAEASGATVAGAACFASRGDTDVRARLGVPLVLSVGLELPAFPAEECPLCAAGDGLQDALDIN